jgi:hypothetical protein
MLDRGILIFQSLTLKWNITKIYIDFQEYIWEAFEDLWGDPFMTSFIIYYEWMWLKSKRTKKLLVAALHIEFQQNLTMVHGKHGKTEQCCLCCEKMSLIMRISHNFIASLKCKTLYMCSSPQSRVVQRLQAGRSGVRVPTRTRHFFSAAE